MDDKSQNEEIIDADIVESTDSTVPGDALSGADQATALLSLEELIKNHIESTDKLRDEIKKVREMYDDSFNNSPAYNEASLKLKDVAKARNTIKQQISKQPSVATIAQKLKDLRFDLSEQNKTLSDLVQDYREQTGATQIETRSGQMMEIISTAKLVRKSKFNP